ncbi:MAG: molybdopterin molybdotransferase MoeA [Burkholderiaceae bacterium]|nr:MAG: molybdopterin molybdotransferase MoeA [Burkholderiaceae bacterium]MBE7420792.1 molybdopterin molybdotransferase MoeA [Ideonella sp.]MBE7427277.1 molybdopterin molybdotransferase MoeA [Ideonella sp.]MCC7286873.1 molybdopterin molybdotransferase MoeA [Burkholderiaceae bacterium]
MQRVIDTHTTLQAQASRAAPLMSLDEAIEGLLEGTRGHVITERETVSTFDALHRVLAQDVHSALAVPPSDNSEMDGYAMHAVDVAVADTVLPVSQRIAAGQVGQPLQPGTAARIFTGAPIPPGADAVVMQELCEAIAPAREGEFGSVRVRTVPTPGLSIRRRGEDVPFDAVVLRRGSRITPQAMGLAAAVGAATLQVCRRPRVALFSTGDELAMPGEPLRPGAIYNSNRFTLRGLLQAAGCTVVDLGIVPDKLDATRDALRRAAAGADLVLTCGGVSVGEEDHLKPALRAEGRLDLWSIAVKPGKPLAFGAVRRSGGETLYVGLPGNPVSSTVTFLVAVMPVLRALCGAPPQGPRPIAMTAGFDWPAPVSRREFLRARIAADGRLEIYTNQGSGVLTSLVWADGLIDNPPGQKIARGDRVQFLPLPMLLS